MEWDHRFNTTYFINEIMNDLVPNLKATGTFPDKKWDRLQPTTSESVLDDHEEPNNSADK
jgi:hypothetical protein